MYRTCTSLGIQISWLKHSTARRTGEHIRHLTHSQFKDSRCIRSFEYTSSLFQTFANIQNISMEPQLILVEINFYRSCYLSKSWKSEFMREFLPCLNLNMNYIQTLSNWWKITFEFKESQGWFFQSKSYFVFEKSKHLWIHYLGEYHISIWLRIFLRSNNRRYHERAHYHCLVHVKVHRFVVAKCVKSANGSESEPSSRFIANVIEILKRHFAYIQILPCSVSPLTISLSLSLLAEMNWPTGR